MTHVVLPLVAFVALTLALPVQGPGGLSAAQALYAAAQYEDAIRAFDALKAGGDLAPGAALPIEQGRALCLLALDRKADAQRAIEAILELDPFFQPAEEDAAPKIRAAFREVRRRVLPAAVQLLYSRAKQAYDRKAFDEADAGFTRVLALLDDPDLTLESGARADMRLVAKAFGDLARAAAAPPPAPVVPASPPAAAGTAQPAAASPAADPAASIYGVSSPDVSAPVPLRTDVNIPSSLRPVGVTREVIIEVVISAAGTIESATVRQSPESVYNAFVTRSAMDWRYKPARKAGVAVRYRMLVKVLIAPPGGGQIAR
jgi:tetratricopeptide (TPR) repeat protein